MPFLGQDWRSPGWSWIKTEDGWKRCESCNPELGRESSQCNLSHDVILNSEDEEIFNNEECEYASKKRKKDHFRSDTNTQSFYREKWIYVHKESTKERHGYCTLGEAFNRLDFSSAIQDIRRFTYVVKLLQLIAKSQLTSLSGVAQKNYFNILDKIVQKVLCDHQNPRLIKNLLQDLSSTLCTLIRGVGKSVLVGNINIWICRLETVLNWQQQLQNLQMTKQVNDGLTLSDLPLHTLSNILHRFSDGWDVVTLGQVTPTLYVLSEDRQLWKKLCQYHFAEKQETDVYHQACKDFPLLFKLPWVQLDEKQISSLTPSYFAKSPEAGTQHEHLILSEKGHVEWKLMYFTLQKYYPTKEQYGDTLHFCRHCSILFWKMGRRQALDCWKRTAAFISDSTDDALAYYGDPQLRGEYLNDHVQLFLTHLSFFLPLPLCGSFLRAKDYHLAWLLKDSGHPCTAADPDSCFTPVSPQHFIDLFKF